MHPRLHARKTPELRLFISSTFVDLAEEREYLVKHIFPEIRAAARERGVEFTEIDLRWGITSQEVEEGKTIKTCLDEVDRCRPYFIGILGSRYGWQPAREDVTKDSELLEQFPWVAEAVASGMSVTEMEMSYGALGDYDKRHNAFFYFRKPDDTTEENVTRLRKRILASGFPVLDGYSGVEELGAQVRADMLKLIEEEFPATTEPEPLEIERRANEAYAHTRRRAYVPNPAYIHRLTAFANDADSERKPLVVIGKSGSGKSSLIAYWSNEYRNIHPHVFVITHYVGASHSSPASLIRHIMLEIKERAGSDDAIPEQADELERDLPQWLARLPDEKIVIALDAVNQLVDPRGHGLNWLPSFIPPNIHPILSTTDDAYYPRGKDDTTLQNRHWQEFVVEALNQEERHEVTKHYLSQFHKTLTREQLEALATSEKCASPLFLRTVLEELRIFGKYKEIDERIAYYLASSDTGNLFQRVLERMEQDYGTAVMREVLSAIWAARHGLSENELLGIIAGINRYELSHLLHALDFHLIRNAGLLNFFHTYLRNAVETRYLSSEKERGRVHSLIAEYFTEQPLSNRVIDEGPWQWLKAGNPEALAKCVLDLDHIYLLLAPEKRYELIPYWRMIESEFSPSNVLLQMIDVALASAADHRHMVKFMLLLGRFYIIMTYYSAASEIFDKAAKLARSSFGETGELTLDALDELAEAYYHESKYSESEAIQRDALAVREEMYEPDALELCNSLDNLGAILFAQSKNDEALQLFSKSLHISEIHLDSESPDHAKRLNNFAAILSQTGMNEKAEEIMRSAIRILEKKYGKSHSAVLGYYSSLGVIFNQLGMYDKAMEVLNHALRGQQSIFGKEHNNVMTTLNNLLYTLTALKRYNEAMKIAEELLLVRSKILGQNHLDTYRAHLAIARIHYLVGNVEDSRNIFINYFPKIESMIGADHWRVNLLRDQFKDFL